jgi:autotransporter-associated beta strand protein
VGGSGLWSSGTSWSTNPVIPGGASSIVNFNTNIGAGVAVTLDTSRIVGIVNVGDTNNSASYTFSGSTGAILTFDNGGAGAQLNHLAGAANADLINSSIAIALNDNLAIANLASPGGSQTRALTVNSAISASSAGLKTLSNVGTGASSIVLAGAITNGSGSVAVTQDSATSTLFLNGNSGTSTGYSGGLNINQGTVVFGHNGSWGQGTVNIGAVTGSTAVTINVNSARNISTTNTQNWNQNFTFLGSNSLHTGAGAVNLSGNRIVTVVSNTMTVGGAISDGGNTYALTKSGTGVLALSAASTYTGATEVSAGTLLLNSAASLASQSYVISQGATFDVSSKASYNLAAISGFTGITFKLDSLSAGLFNAGSAGLTFDDQLTLDFSTASLIGGTTYNLFDMGSQTGSFTTVTLAGSFSGGLALTGDLWKGTSGGYDFEFDEATGILSVTAVPEPSTCLLLGVGAVPLLWRRRQKA